MDKNTRTSFFFIDEQGGNNKQQWIIAGGVVIDARVYHLVSRRIDHLRSTFLNGQVREIKFSELQRAIHLKRQGYNELKKDIAYLQDYTIEQMRQYIRDFFEILNHYDFLIITCISKKELLPNDTFLLKFQIEDLMQRAQYCAQDYNLLMVIVHDHKSDKKIDKYLQNVYKTQLKTSRFIRDHDRIIDNLFIEHSYLNTGIQISDFVIGVISGVLRDYSFSKEIYNEYVGKHIRRNSKNEIIGYGVIPTGLTQNKSFRSELRSKLTIEDSK